MSAEMSGRFERVTRCSDGQSPAQVFRCETASQVFFRKTLDTRYSGTTYGVLREARMMRWLHGKLDVPRIVDFGTADGQEYLLMTGLSGTHLDQFAGNQDEYIPLLARAVQALHAVDITDCPFSAGVDFRLQELRFLMDSGLADTDPDNWEEDTEFSDPEALYAWLLANRPAEENPVLSHGDLPGNLIIQDGQPCFFDLGRTGIADMWQDLALCVRELRALYPDSDAEDHFFRLLNITPDPEKIRYYILLDELF